MLVRIEPNIDYLGGAVNCERREILAAFTQLLKLNHVQHVGNLPVAFNFRVA